MERIYKFKLNSKGSKDTGFLVPLEFSNNIPFEIKRIFYTYNVPTYSERGFHAYHSTQQILICLYGKIKTKCFDGKYERIYELNSYNEALYISPHIWRTTFEYSKDAVLLVLSSLEYNEEDYIRDYDKFLEVINCI